MKRHLKDNFVRQAKKMNYRSRAAFKLLQFQARFQFIRPGMKVVDLGSAPGSWTQVLVQQARSQQSNPTIIGIDVTKIEPVRGAEFINKSILDSSAFSDILKFFQFKKCDLVVSDMAPQFVGNRLIDHVASVQLSKSALYACIQLLRKGGNFVVKVNQGPLEEDLFAIHELTGINPQYLDKNFDQFIKYCQEKDIKQEYLKKHRAQLEKSGISFDDQQLKQQLQQSYNKAKIEQELQEYEKNIRQDNEADKWEQKQHMQDIIKQVQKKLDELRSNLSKHSPQAELKYRHKKREEEEQEQKQNQKKHLEINPHKNVQRQTTQTTRRDQREHRKYESRRKGQTARQSQPNQKNSILWDEDDE